MADQNEESITRVLANLSLKQHWDASTLSVLPGLFKAVEKCYYEVTDKRNKLEKEIDGAKLTISRITEADMRLTQSMAEMT